MKYSRILNRVDILFFLIIIPFLINSCGFIIEPDPYENKDAKPVSVNLSIVDSQSEHPFVDGHTMYQSTAFRLLPDNRNYSVKISDIFIDDVKLKATYRSEASSFLQYSKDGVVYNMYVLGNRAGTAANQGIPDGLKGEHLIRFVCIVNSFEAGLGAFLPNASAEVMLNFR